jgi:electron transfer flavoprotein beta subunit
VKIFVSVKRVADPDNANKVQVTDDGKQIVTDNLEQMPNPFDEYAVETALRILEDGKGALRGDIIVATIGPEAAEQQIRQCLGMGVSEGIIVDGCDRDLDSFVTGDILAELIKRESPDLVIMGKQTTDGDAGQVPLIVAEKLNWPRVTCAGFMDVAEDLKSATVFKEADGGILKVHVKFPAVISVDLRIVSPLGVVNNVALL